MSWHWKALQNTNCTIDRLRMRRKLLNVKYSVYILRTQKTRGANFCKLANPPGIPSFCFLNDDKVLTSYLTCDQIKRSCNSDPRKLSKWAYISSSTRETIIFIILLLKQGCQCLISHRISPDYSILIILEVPILVGY